MTVVPAGAILRDLIFVGQGLSGAYWALSNTRNSIVLHAMELAHTVPVDSRTIRLHVIGYVDDKIITPVGGNRRTRHGPIERHAGAFVSVLVANTFFRRQPYLHSIAGVGKGGVVVRINFILIPTASGIGCVLARLEGLLKRP